MPLQFTKEEIEGALAAALPHGLRRRVAQVSGLGESYIKRQFNPDDETPSCAFKLLQVACALDDIDSELGDEFWEVVTRFRELSKKRQPARVTDVAGSTGKFNKEVAEFVMKKLQDAPIGDQLSELEDAQRALDELRTELMNEYDRLQQQQPAELRAVK
jgi:hypothetical protein